MSSPLSRSARGEINQLPCVFSVALGQRHAVCSLALHDTELRCTQPLARAACASLHGLLREKARFALGQRTDPLNTSPGQSNELRLQCGGLSGLRTSLDPDAMAIDVVRVLEQLACTDMDSLPWEQILRTIANWPNNR